VTISYSVTLSTIDSIEMRFFSNCIQSYSDNVKWTSNRDFFNENLNKGDNVNTIINPFQRRVVFGVVGCCILLLFVSFATNKSIQAKPFLFVQQTAVTLHVVEKQRFEDNEYDQLWFDCLTNQGKNPTTHENKKEMVQDILDKIGNEGSIQELNIYGHGSSGFISMGLGQSKELTKCTYLNGNEEDWKKDLKPLKGRFTDGARINLIGCYVGSGIKGAKKLTTVAEYFGVAVRAPVGGVMAGVTSTIEWKVVNPGENPVPVAPKRVKPK